nr:MAG TPA_asm: hypothetical protein [Caudoviricetes sp.]
MTKCPTAGLSVTSLTRAVNFRSPCRMLTPSIRRSLQRASTPRPK